MLPGILLLLIISLLFSLLSLMKIYSVGPEVYFSVRYKARQRKTTPELRRAFQLRLLLLWAMEILSVIGAGIWVLVFLGR